MAKTEEVFKSISDEDLKKAIIEINEDNQNYNFRDDGVVKRCCKMISEIVGNSTVPESFLFMSTISLIKEAAFRFSQTK